MLDAMLLLLATLIFLSPTDPRLNEESWDICACDICNEENQQVIDELFAMGVELAAPQFGIPKAVLLVEVDGRLREFINPQIVWKSDETILWKETCPSTEPICGLVPRHARIAVRAYDRQCNLFVEEFAGKTAQMLQHEIDHLDGIRFPDRISNDEDLSCDTWPHKALRQMWLQIKNGLVEIP